MSLVRRSIRSLIRSPLRTVGIVAILTVSMSLALIMLTVHGAAQNQLASIGDNIGTEIQVRPAGSYGFTGGGEPLNEEDVDKLNDIPHIVSVQKSVQIQYTSDSLQSAFGPGTLGLPFRQGDLGGGSLPPNFRLPITITGTDSAVGEFVLMGDAHPEITGGRYFTTEESDADVVVVGQALADKNGLGVGSQFEIEGVTVEVIGVFTTGQRFGDSMLVIPVDTVQRLFDLEGVTSVTVVADYVGNVDAVVAAVRGIFDEATADIVTTADMYEGINEPLVNAGNASQTGMIAAFAVAAVVILFSVVLMVRQRVREIGILKAIGASNWHIGFQFSVEALAMSIVAAVIGALITFALAQKVANSLVTTPTGPGGEFMGGFAREGGAFGGRFTTFAGINIAVSPEIFLYALAMAIALGVVASIFPSWYISRVKPAEVLRNE